MARAYLQGQGQEREWGPWQSHHRYQEHQKQGHQYRHHHVPPTDDVQHGPPTPGLAGGS